MEKNGLLKRLAGFWLQGAPELDGGLRHLWQYTGKRPRADTAAERGFPFLREEGARDSSLRRAAGASRETGRGTRPGRGLLFAEGFREREAAFSGGEGPAGHGKRRNRQAAFPVGTSGKARGAGLPEAMPTPFGVRQEDMEAMPMAARAFYWDDPQGTARRRKPIPLAGGARHGNGRAGEESAAAVRSPAAKGHAGELPRRQTAGQAAGYRRDALPDIDGLMREMTKRLWAEREGCGRRLGG